MCMCACVEEVFVYMWMGWNGVERLWLLMDCGVSGNVGGVGWENCVTAHVLDNGTNNE